MNRFRLLIARLRGVFASRSQDAQLDLLADEHERRGLSRADAERAALRDFGGVMRVKGLRYTNEARSRRMPRSHRS
ncbi:MAG TPA: hypothetical protein VGQ16_04865 [Vicinamibacterales bacterium]|jgi:hypothetical protein|nr:hypothetical protein [Vicinamibacterales bacterium]